MLDGVTVSSTHIRELLEAGDVAGANRFLGHPYSLSDVVRSGRHVGRTIGRPTVNMDYAPQVLVPRRGVYATAAYTPDGVYPAVTNIGVRPTVDQSADPEVTVEPYLLDFDGDLYGRELSVWLAAFTRSERPFSSMQALRGQLARDKKDLEAYFKQ